MRRAHGDRAACRLIPKRDAIHRPCRSEIFPVALTSSTLWQSDRYSFRELSERVRRRLEKTNARMTNVGCEGDYREVCGVERRRRKRRPTSVATPVPSSSRLGSLVPPSAHTGRTSVGSAGMASEGESFRIARSTVSNQSSSFRIWMMSVTRCPSSAERLRLRWTARPTSTAREANEKIT